VSFDAAIVLCSVANNNFSSDVLRFEFSKQETRNISKVFTVKTYEIYLELIRYQLTILKENISRDNKFMRCPEDEF